MALMIHTGIDSEQEVGRCYVQFQGLRESSQSRITVVPEMDNVWVQAFDASQKRQKVSRIRGVLYQVDLLAFGFQRLHIERREILPGSVVADEDDRMLRRMRHQRSQKSQDTLGGNAAAVPFLGVTLKRIVQPSSRRCGLII